MTDLANALRDEGGLDESECFIDASFASTMGGGDEIGDHAAPWACRMTRRPVVDFIGGLDPDLVREMYIGDEELCLVDPGIMDRTSAELDAAWANGEVKILVVMSLRDGAHNQTRMVVGEVEVNPGACAVELTRDPGRHVIQEAPCSRER